MKKIFITNSARETRLLGRKIGRRLQAGDVLALTGELGSGKTVLSQGMARGLKVKEPVTSASFVLCQKFSGRLTFYHLDFYRLSEAEILDGEFEEIISSTSVTVVEWAEKAAKILPPDIINIKIEYLGAKKRRLTISSPAVKMKRIFT